MSNIVSTRLTQDQKRKFEILANEKGLNVSILLKHIINEYITNHMSNLENNNLIHMQLINLRDDVKKLSVKEEWFEQLFYCWLENWFLSHPKIEDTENLILMAKNARNRRNEFIKKFNENVFNEDEIIYDRLFMNAQEGKKEE